jgi:hypothetical protein
MTQSDILREHGTEFMRLKPMNIVQAALADLRLLEKKRLKQADPDAKYSFARKHVLRARDYRHLIALAYFEVPPPTDKHSTLVIYGDRNLLRQTLVELLAADPDEPRRARDHSSANDPIFEVDADDDSEPTT